jgi:ribosomal protein S6--L-glutamate ligase
MRVLWLGWEDAYAVRRIHEAAAALGFEVVTAALTDVCLATDAPWFQARADRLLGLEDFDALVARVAHPYVSETLTAVRLFHEAGRPVIDASLADEGVAMSKMHDYLVLARRGLAVPRTWQPFDTNAMLARAEELGYPVVLKGVHGSYGTHVHLAADAGEARRIAAGYPDGDLMVQEYLPGSVDYRVLVVGYRALPAITERTPAPGDFRTNAALGGGLTARPASEFPDLVELAEAAARALRREFAAVDLRYAGARPAVLEVNRRPRFENFERATRLDVAGAFLQHVLSRCRADRPDAPTKAAHEHRTD